MRKMKDATLRVAVIVVLVGQVLVNTGLLGQSIWPGDINNNGVVNGVDLLYHAIAEGSTGPSRPQTGTAWAAYGSSAAWSGTFSDGINYKSADVDGLGNIDDNDRKSLWEDNYGNTHGNVTADVYPTGDAQLDPELRIEASQATVSAGQTLELDVFLGNANRPVTHFYGITFTLSFAADYIKDETLAPLWNPNAVSFNLTNNTWLNGAGDNAAETFVRLNNEAGELEVVILRKEYGTVSGHGEIASVMVVIEDIVFLQNTSTEVTVENIKMIDDELQEYPVVGSSQPFTILASSWQSMTSGTATNTEQTAAMGIKNATTPANDGRDGESLTKPKLGKETLEISVYPNPVVETVNINTPAEDELEAVRLYSAEGRLVQMQQLNETTSTQLDVSNLPRGNYFLQLTTQSGTTTKQITK